MPQVPSSGPNKDRAGGARKYNVLRTVPTWMVQYSEDRLWDSLQTP